MTLPASGQISMSQVVTEFGGGAPASFSQYYRGGGLVPNTAQNAGVPTSGQISLSNFYGASAATNTITPAAIFGGAQTIGYQSSPAFGAISPTTVNGQAVFMIMDRNDGVSPVHQFWLELLTPSLPQNFFTSLTFTDKNGVQRVFNSNGVGRPVTYTPNIAGHTAWHWNADSYGTALFWDVGVAYPLIIV